MIDNIVHGENVKVMSDDKFEIFYQFHIEKMDKRELCRWIIDLLPHDEVGDMIEDAIKEKTIK